VQQSEEKSDGGSDWIQFYFLSALALPPAIAASLWSSDFQPVCRGTLV
jgi:hypothetical protein